MTHEELVTLHGEYKASTDPVRRSRIENRIIKENYNLVRKLVDKLRKRLTTVCHADEDDLLQSGCMGMLNAWKKFDPTKARFSTYAAHWIRHYVQDCLSDEQPIYKPRQSGKTWATYRLQEMIKAQTGRDATAEELGVSEKQFEEWRSSPVVRSLDEMSNDLHQHFGPGANGYHINMGHAGNGLHDLLADPKANPEKQVENAEMTEMLVAGMKTLTAREALIIQRLFLEGEKYSTVAKEVGLSEEGVRLERLSALGKLRQSIELAEVPES